MLFLNGEFVSPKQAKIDPSDRGFLLADGLFETLRSYQGRIFAVDRHWRRLKQGAAALNIPIPIQEKTLHDVFKHLLSLNRLRHTDASLRLTLTRGPGPRGLLPSSQITPTLLITCNQLQVNNTPRPVSLKTSKFVLNEHSTYTQFKTLNYLDKILARQEVESAGYDDALLLNTQQLVASASAANIFMVKDGRLLTPALACGPLPGITREIVLECAKQLGLDYEEALINLSTLESAEEVFLTNSLIGIQVVYKINEATCPSTPGPLTKQLQNAFNLISQET